MPVRYVYWSVLILGIQWLIAPAIAVRGIQADFVFLFVLYVALYGNPNHALPLGFFVGLGQDVLCGTPFGLNALIQTVVAYIPHLLRARLFLSSWLTQLFCVAVFSFGSDLLESIYFLTVGQHLATHFLARAGGHILWNLALFGFVFGLAKRLNLVRAA